ncbi:hypothetical protein BJX64DRAFT_43325 [Aspergillus heterothallicus]
MLIAFLNILNILKLWAIYTLVLISGQGAYGRHGAEDHRLQVQASAIPESDAVRTPSTGHLAANCDAVVPSNYVWYSGNEASLVSLYIMGPIMMVWIARVSLKERVWTVAGKF